MSINLFGQSEQEEPILDALHLSESNEWYTPAVYIQAARRVMGSIALDPASNAIANLTVKAERYFDAQMNGLVQEWKARTLWINPPYGYIGTSRQVGQVKLWIEKLVKEYQSGNVEQAMILVNATTEKRWFDPLWPFPICFVSKRISFISPSGAYGRPPHANAIVYLGSHEARFAEVFQDEDEYIGPVVKRMSVVKVARSTLWDGAA